MARAYQPTVFRPITLLNTIYKILALIIAGRIRPVLEKLLHPSQYGERPGNTTFDAIATVRDAISYAALPRRLLCVVTLDFKEVFERISHKSLFTILRSYGFSDVLMERIKQMYKNATSVVQINGHLSAPSQYSALYDRDAF